MIDYLYQTVLIKKQFCSFLETDTSLLRNVKYIVAHEVFIVNIVDLLAWTSSIERYVTKVLRKISSKEKHSVLFAMADHFFLYILLYFIAS